MGDLLLIIIKAIIAVSYLFLVIKILGKKQISELNIFDYIIGLSLGNIAAEMTVNKEITILNGLFAMTVYGLFSLFVSIITTKSIIARRFIIGFPVVIIENGKIIRDQLIKCKLDVNDLLQDARESGYFDISQINYAVMEPSGKISFLPKVKYQPATLNDLKIRCIEQTLCANLIIDGNIMENNLKAINHDEKWLLKKLKNEGYNDPKELLLVICNNKEQLTIYPMKGKVSTSVLE